MWGFEGFLGKGFDDVWLCGLDFAVWIGGQGAVWIGGQGLGFRV